jgi:MFS family permease
MSLYNYDEVRNDGKISRLFSPQLRGTNQYQAHEEYHKHQDPDESQESFYQAWKNSLWAGSGLFGESYLLFSIGLMRPFWQMLYPDCLDGTTCSPRLLNSLTYSVVLGVICGMMVMGYGANQVGRRVGSIATAAFMSCGSLALAGASLVLAQNERALFSTTSTCLFLFGFGVGGEYPLSSSSATEKAMAQLKLRIMQQQDKETDTPAAISHQRQYRGRAVQLVFMNQGTGILVNSLCLVVLLLIFGQYGEQAEKGLYNINALLAIWRITYCIAAILLIFVLVSRILYLKESQVWAEQKKQQRDGEVDALKGNNSNLDYAAPTAAQTALQNPHPLVEAPSSLSSLSTPSSVMVGDVAPEEEPNEYTAPELPTSSTSTEQDVQCLTPTQLLVRHYGLRLVGTAGSWLLWDIAFYGNKLFQSTFLLALTGEQTTLLEFCLAASMNAFVGLLGYIGAALLLDRVGRLKLQLYGFLLTGVLFVCCGMLPLPSAWLILLYFASSLVGQLGPNATTFLTSAEIFPTEFRTACHGIAAASGKVGALIAAIGTCILSAE